MEDIKKRLGHNLLKRRLAADWTQDECAERAGMSKRTYQEIELAHAWPQYSNLLALGRLWGVDPASLLSPMAPKPSIEDAMEVLAEYVEKTQKSRHIEADVSKGPIPPDILTRLEALPPDHPRWAAVRAALGIEPGQAAASDAPGRPKAKK